MLPICYLHYNADLVEIGSDPTLGTTAIGWVDDVVYFTVGNMVAKSTNKLKTMIPKALDWSGTHTSQFDANKLHFTSNEPKLTFNWNEHQLS